MAYSLNTDVQAEFKSLTYNANTVTAAKVDEWIAQADAYIDTMLNSQYVVPITGTASLEVVKMISTWLVADRVRDILTLLPGANAASQEFAQDYFKKATELLTMLKKGQVTLPDAPLAGDGAGGVSGYAQANGLQPEFKRYSDQW